MPNVKTVLLHRITSTILVLVLSVCEAAISQPNQLLTPVSGSDGLFETAVVNGVKVFRTTYQQGSFSPFMYFQCEQLVHNRTVYLRLTYLDLGNGVLNLAYNSTSGDYRLCTGQYNNCERNTGSIRIADYELTQADFRKAQNLGADLRICCDGTFQMNIVSAELSDQPTEPFVEMKRWIGAYTGPKYSGSDVVDASTLVKKVVCGYQGWFRAPGDPSGADWWRGYFGADQNHPSVDLWPDVDEYSPEELYNVPGWKLASGKQARLFSSATRKTVIRHFQWMQAYGIDGATVVRFCVNISPSRDRESYRILAYAREAANLTGRVFCVDYDMSGFDTTKVVQLMADDWHFLVDSMKLTQDDRYLRHNGKPVVRIFGFISGWIPPRVAREMIGIFQAGDKYSAFVVGSGESVPARSVNSPDTAWRNVFRSMGADQPWNVGGWNKINDTTWANTDEWKLLQDSLASSGVMFMPLIFPGFTWDNMWGYTPGSTYYPRLKGKFMWKQFIAAKALNAQAIEIAMYDEINEGTAIFKVTNDIPVNHYFATIEGVPSDFYLLLTGYGTRVMNGSTALPPTMPDFAAMSQPPIPDVVSPAFGDTVFSRLTITWTRVAHPSGITGYEVELDGVVTKVSDTTFKPILSDGNHTARVRALNGLGVKGGWSLVQTFTFRALAPPANASLMSPPNQSLNVPVLAKFVWRRCENATSYTLQLSQDSMFVTVVLSDSTISDTLRQVSLPAHGVRFFWRVRGNNMTASGPWSNVWSFTAIVSVPKPPTLAAPADSARGLSTTPILSWARASGAVTYRLQVSTSLTFSTMVVNDSTVVDPLRSIGPLQNATTYFWRVSAKNEGGTGGWSQVRSFTTVVAPPQAPVLAIPADSAINVQLNVTLAWNAVQGAAFYHLQVSTRSNFGTRTVDDSALSSPWISVGPLGLAATYYWQVRAKNEGGWSAYSSVRQFSTIRTTSVEQLGKEIPKEYSLSQNYPNPFNPSTTIRFGLPRGSHVSVRVYDLLGKEIATLVSQELTPGYYLVRWQADVPSGTYIYRLQAGEFVEVKKMILLH